MKTVVLLTLVLVSSVLMGCTTDPCKADCCCGTMNANCCGWDFYKPCRMLRNDDASCGCTPCPTEIVLKDCTPMDAAPADAAPADAPAEMAPAEMPAAEGSAEPVAEYGAPPAGR